MPTFRVHYERTTLSAVTGDAHGTLTIDADNSEDAANKARQRLGAIIITKIKVDRSGGKSSVADKIIKEAEARGYRVFQHTQQLTPQPDIIGVVPGAIVWDDVHFASGMGDYTKEELQATYEKQFPKALRLKCTETDHKYKPGAYGVCRRCGGERT